ncbi:hypothetical protein SK128_028311 [Halocaridina rubra]|uniref:Uncharacterized protein n=1 Tax=Halocaridina rubra TaxID=373956 RepID=A0AAN8ZTQ7_HALRR
MARSTDKIFTLLSESGNNDIKALNWSVLVWSDVFRLDLVKKVGNFSMRSSRGICMQQWHSDVIFSITDTDSTVILYAMDSDTLQVTPIGDFNRTLHCDFQIESEGRMLIACIRTPSDISSDEVTAGVSIFQLEWNTLGRNYTLHHLHHLLTQSTSHLTLWYD